MVLYCQHGEETQHPPGETVAAPSNLSVNAGQFNMILVHGQHHIGVRIEACYHFSCRLAEHRGKLGACPELVYETYGFLHNTPFHIHRSGKLTFFCRSAKQANTSPWHALGAQKHSSVLPLSSCSAAINSGCLSIQFSNLRITSSRVPSLPITNGLPHLLGRPIYTAWPAALFLSRICATLVFIILLISD